MLRHRLLLATMLGTTLLAGCHQFDLRTSTVSSAYKIDVQLPRFDPLEPACPQPAPGLGRSTVNDPELPKRPISLAECRALALEHGRTGMFFDGPGSMQRGSVTGLTEFRNPTSATDAIRVFAYDPAIAATHIEESLARFDTWAETSAFWNRIDQPNRFLTPLSSFDEVLNRNKVDDVDFSTGFFRRLPTGGFAGMRFRYLYEKNELGPNNTQVVNPAHRPLVDFSFEQPLLQGAGVFINQVRDQHPGSLRRTYPDIGRPPGILLARISHRQQQLEFERQVHELIYRVEEAYWQLYSAYWDFYSIDNGLKQAHVAWQIAKARFDAGGVGGVGLEDLTMIEEQYQYFRQQRLQALGRGQPGRPGVLEAERRLRYIIGLPSDDGERLIPCDAPEYVAYNVDLDYCVLEAQIHRPELKQVEEEIRGAYLNLAKAKDRLKPDLRFVGRYGINGLGDTFGSSIGDISNNPHHEWEVGVRLQYPVGFRAGHAESMRANAQLGQRLTFLADQREKLLFSLQRSHQELVQYQEQYKVRIRQREVAALQLKVRSEKFKAGGDPKQPSSSIDLMLRAQRNWADAVREEFIALGNHRIAIADFERQKGTLLRYANVTIAEDTVPLTVKPRASEHLRRWHSKPPRTASVLPKLPVQESDPTPLTSVAPPPSWPRDPEPTPEILPVRIESVRTRPAPRDRESTVTDPVTPAVDPPIPSSFRRGSGARSRSGMD